MDAKLHVKHKDIELSSQQIKMFADIIETDPVLTKVLLFVTKHSYTSNNAGILTIAEICNNVYLERKVLSPKKQGKPKFESQKALIDRKQAERKMDTLYKMSLCYYENLLPLKPIHITDRGKAICNELINRIQKSNQRSDD